MAAMQATIERLQGIFADVFQQPDLEIHEGTSARDIEAWDSLMHVTLMVNVESVFGVRFTSLQLAQIASVGDLVKAIEAARP
jgi:acyl carrier protein